MLLPSEGPTSGHPHGHNVLYIGGNVRYATSHGRRQRRRIYRNQLGEVAAGVNRVDALGVGPTNRCAVNDRLARRASGSLTHKVAI